MKYSKVVYHPFFWRALWDRAVCPGPQSLALLMGVTWNCCLHSQLLQLTELSLPYTNNTCCVKWTTGHLAWRNPACQGAFAVRKYLNLSFPHLLLKWYRPKKTLTMCVFLNVLVFIIKGPQGNEVSMVTLHLDQTTVTNILNFKNMFYHRNRSSEFFITQKAEAMFSTKILP